MAALFFNTVSTVRQILNYFFAPALRSKYDLPHPPESHVIISNKLIGELPIVIVGDIHGCFDELQDLLAKAKDVTKSEKIFLICVGDMLSKGPKSLEVLRLLREMAVKGQAVAVRGNHEESILREYRNMNADNHYVLSKKYEYLATFSQSDFEYLQTLPYSLIVPQINAIIVHAGLVPNIPLKYQSYIDLCHMRNIVLKQRLWGKLMVSNSKADAGVGWATQWEGPEHVYFGHDARRGLQELQFATGLDTGCVYGGALTGVIITNNNHRQFISISAKQPYRSTDLT